MNFKKTGYETIDKYAKELFELSTFMHQNPELAFKEHKAHDYITSFLESKGFQVERNFKLETGFHAVYETAPTPHLVIMVEMDALPELGHACGHNLIAECSIAAGLAVMEIMKIHNFKGKLSLLGTPAEEYGGGKINFVREGFFKDVDVALLCHPSYENVVHKCSLAVSQYKITFHGKESHAACSPWLGRNALDAAVMAYQSVSCLRQQIHPDCRIAGIILRGGDATNIIPHFTEMEYEIRAPKIKDLKEITERVFTCFHGAAQSTGCQVNICEVCPTYEDVIGNKCLLDLFEKNAAEIHVPMIDNDNLSDGSTDVGNVSHVCPTIQPVFYIGTKASTHTKEFALQAGKEEAQEYVLNQAKIITGTLVDILDDNTGDLLSKIKSQFQMDIKEQYSF